MKAGLRSSPALRAVGSARHVSFTKIRDRNTDTLSVESQKLLSRFHPPLFPPPSFPAPPSAATQIMESTTLQVLKARDINLMMTMTTRDGLYCPVIHCHYWGTNQHLLHQLPTVNGRSAISGEVHFSAHLIRMTMGRTPVLHHRCERDSTPCSRGSPRLHLSHPSRCNPMMLVNVHHLKRKVADLTPSSKPSSPEKKVAKIQAESAIRTALRVSGEDGEKNGLMQFFKKCTREEYEAQCKRARALSDESYAETLDERKAIQANKVAKRREDERQRQLKHRAKTKQSEIASGIRSSVNLKDVSLDLRDDPTKRSRTELAELSRPAREIREHDRKRRKQRSKDLSCGHRSSKPPSTHPLVAA